MAHAKGLCTLVFVLAMGGGPASAYDGVTQVGETGERIVSFVRKMHDDAGFSGAVLAARDGKVIAAVAVGEVGGKSDEPLAVDSLFEIASCTKPFTAVTVMKLVEAGKLGLDDPIADHLPGVPDDSRAITVRHLLQHTSGIPRSNSKGRGKDLTAVLPTFLAGGPQTTPGARHEYWNQGYALLSEVIARASGESYTRCVRELVLKPCKMTNTRFTGQRAPRGVEVAVGASRRGDRSALDHPYGEYGFQYRGMGGLVTNLIDLWRWDRSLAQGELLSPESIAEMTEPGPGGYALGWRVERLGSGATVHSHTGSVRGFLASIRRNPSDDGCLFVLANSDASGPFNQVKIGCETILADAWLKGLVGVYRDSAGRTLTVERDGENAKATIDWHGPKTYGYLAAAAEEGLLFGTMRRYDPAGFVSADSVTIERNDAGSIAALVLTIAANDTAIRFDRTP